MQNAGFLMTRLNSAVVAFGTTRDNLFFRFEDKENISGVNNAKSSVQRGVKASVLEQFPFTKDYMDQILPKKDALKLVKW